MNELKVNPKWISENAPVGEFKASNGVEFSHVAIDTCGDRLFFKAINFADNSGRRLQLRIEFTGSVLDGVEFRPAVGRAIGRAILDLCKEEDGE